MSKKLTHAEASAQANAAGYKLVSYAGSSNAYGSIFECKCGHKWSAKHNNVVSSNKTGCPKCALKATRFSAEDVRNSLSACDRTLLSIDSPIRGQSTMVTTKCSKGHVSKTKLGTIIYAKKPCGECSKINRAVTLEDFNRRLAHRGYRIAEWGGTTRTIGAIECSCGTTWEARVNSVLHEQSHCPACYEGGFRGDQSAVFYIYELRKNKLLRYGYGISGRFQSRDAEHKRNAAAAGWKIRLHKLFTFEKGISALAVERGAKAKFPVPKDMFSGFKTESIMPRYLDDLVATLTNSDTIQQE